MSVEKQTYRTSSSSIIFQEKPEQRIQLLVEWSFINYKNLMMWESWTGPTSPFSPKSLLEQAPFCKGVTKGWLTEERAECIYLYLWIPPLWVLYKYTDKLFFFLNITKRYLWFMGHFPLLLCVCVSRDSVQQIKWWCNFQDLNYSLMQLSNRAKAI